MVVESVQTPVLVTAKEDAVTHALAAAKIMDAKVLQELNLSTVSGRNFTLPDTLF